MQNAPNASKHSFLPHLFSCERKDGAAGGNKQSQIFDNLSVSAAPSQLPWEGSQGVRAAGSAAEEGVRLSTNISNSKKESI